MQGIHQRKGNATNFSNELPKKKKTNPVFLKIRTNCSFDWLQSEKETVWQVKRKPRPMQADRKVLPILWGAIIYKTMQIWSSLVQMSNEMVTSLKGTLFRVIPCSVRHAVTHLSPSPRPGSHTMREKPQGRRVVTCCPLDSSILICGFLHCLEWTPHSHLWFSNLHPMALKTQKYVLHISQMHQHQTLVNPSGVG